MGCEDLFLFFQHACYLFLEGEELLLVFATHCTLHGADVLSHFFLVLIADYVLDLDLFLDLVSLFCRCYGLRRWGGLFYGIGSILFFVLFGLLLGKFLDFLYHFFWGLFWNLFWWFSWLWHFFLLRNNCIGTLRWHFILRVFGF